MSLILDALNRADRERSPNNDGAKRSATAAPVSPFKSAFPSVLIAVAATLAIVGGIFYFNGSPNAIQSVVAKTAEPTARVIENIPKTAAPLVSKQTANETLPEKSDAASISLYKQSVDEQPVDSGEIQSLYDQQPQREVQNVEREPNKDQTAETNTPPTPFLEPLPTPQSAEDKRMAIFESIPLLSQMSPRFQRAIPNIDYSLHVFAENGGFVKINGRQLRVSGQIEPQLRIIAILKNAIVLDYRNTQFRLAALNSWVNY